MSSKRWWPMPPQRRQREYESAVDPDALHIDEGRVTGFGEPKEVLKKSEAQALREKAAKADYLAQLVDQLQQQGNGSELVVQGGAIVIEDFQLTPTSLVAPENVTPESWEQIGKVLLRLEGSIQWLIGDWLVYGLDLKYGEIKNFAEYFERDEHTLYNYMSISRNVESSLRNELLSYNHHVAVSKLAPAEQEYALKYAASAEKRPSVAEFRKWIAENIQGRSTPSLPAGGNFLSMAKEASRFIQRDPTSLKAEDREEGLGYIAQMRAVFDAWEAKARS